MLIDGFRYVDGRNGASMARNERWKERCRGKKKRVQPVQVSIEVILHKLSRDGGGRVRRGGGEDERNWEQVQLSRFGHWSTGLLQRFQGNNRRAYTSRTLRSLGLRSR